jgi:hypothetical protein
MPQDKLERCSNGCCLYVNGTAVTKENYEQAIARHPGSYAGVGSGQRNAILETIVTCRSALNSTNYQQQTKRIEQRVKKLDPSAVVSFDSDNEPNFIRFRIMHDGTELTKAYPHFRTGEVVGWSDEKLDEAIESVTDRLVRRAS